MPKRKPVGRSVSWWVRAAAVFAGAVALAWLVVMASADRAFTPQLLERLGLEQTSSDIVFRTVGQEMMTNRGELSPASYQRVGEAALKDPLASEPFTFFALRAVAQGDLPTGERLLAEARRRNPRDRMARLLLVSVYLRTARIADGVREIGSLLRIMPGAHELLVPELAKLALDPRTRGAIMEAVGAHPLMAAVLNHLAQQDADTDLILSLSSRQPAGTGTFMPWQTKVLGRLTDRGEARRAYQLWLRYLGRTEGPGGTVYDPRFQGLPGPAPFNWALDSSQAGSAEFVAGPAMEVSYFGRAEGVLARQLLLLPPGSYNFEVQAEGDANGEGSRLLWRVMCLRSQSPLFTLPLQEITYTPKRLSGQFRVPPGCDAQWLQLVGVPAEFPTLQSARFTDLKVQAAGGTR